MDAIGAKIKQRRMALGLSQTELAKRLGYAEKSAVSKIESGRVDLPQSKIVKLAAVLGMSPAALMWWEEGPAQAPAPHNLLPIETRPVPLLGNIACGEPIFADTEYEAYVEAGGHIQADFCLRAQGDSMIGARIFDGDLVFVRRQEMVEDGEIAAVLIGEQATLKRVYYDREHEVLQLFAENPRYKTLRYTGAELEQVRILGKAVAFQSHIR